MKTSLVLGLGFGDEGKGRTVSYLVSTNPQPTLVIRFQGGHQAGHTVVYNGIRHVFSTFGSGSLQGAPTLWSKNCTFNPTAVINEYFVLKPKVDPMLYVDPLCPVVTPFDLDANQREEENRKENSHGSVGVGFGATIARHENHYRLYFQDLFFDSILGAKLKLIQSYYGSIAQENWKEKENQFLEDVRLLRRQNWLKSAEEIDLTIFEHIIFEGAQGILLDMDFGFFPNVTRSNTTSKNALELIREWHLPNPAIYYVTRAYQTRHGKGYMTNEDQVPALIHVEHETNSSEGYQGKFRLAAPDPQLALYALTCDENFSRGLDKNLVITCVDQIESISDRHAMLEYRAQLINSHLFQRVFTSFGKETSAMDVKWVF